MSYAHECHGSHRRRDFNISMSHPLFIDSLGKAVGARLQPVRPNDSSAPVSRDLSVAGGRLNVVPEQRVLLDHFLTLLLFREMAFLPPSSASVTRTVNLSIPALKVCRSTGGAVNAELPFMPSCSIEGRQAGIVLPQRVGLVLQSAALDHAQHPAGDPSRDLQDLGVLWRRQPEPRA
jgi:hypothetical protein